MWQVYVSEVTTPEWRTTFGAGLGAFYNLGSVIVFTLGKVGSHCTEISSYIIHSYLL